MLLRIQPVFQEKIWGGERLRTVFRYDLPGDHIGECWAISGHPNGDCTILNPEFRGMMLGTLWNTRRDLFGYRKDAAFPLLVKIIDAKEDLSVQVHPDDSYAMRHENGSLGKTECWYVLDCDPDATIVYGHNARTREEMERMIRENRWNELLREVPVRKGDFFQVDPGCIHALKAGTLILETQQSSDVTYRLYDYGRLQDGKPRRLHIEKSLDVATIPHRTGKIRQKTAVIGDARVTRLIRCPFYTVYRMELDGFTRMTWEQDFVNMSILSGSGVIDGEPVKTGDHLIVPARYGQMTIEGTMELICSHP
ncbi:MAG: class I mannose-6-phosphate isomerase [Clostridia bacterium]|nr:class I mannose-6-phosphate isomerase [Clostridia bacterium]